MAKTFKDKIKITGYDELFGGSSGGKCDAEIREVPLKELYAFANHPFKVKDDEEMAKLAESVKENGVLVPAMARPREKGGFELISGHRRKRAAELAGLYSIPVIIRNIEDDEAIIAMVDANMQRETILPSEKAFSYKMKLDALKHQGKRSDLYGNTTSVPGERKLEAREKIAKDAGESAAQIRRYIRLTELIPGLLDKVDTNDLGLKQGVEISYLNKNEQKSFLSVIKELSCRPNLVQATKIKKLSKEGHCSRDSIYAVLRDEPVRQRKVVIKQERLREYFSEDTTDEEIERTIFELLDNWRNSH